MYYSDFLKLEQTDMIEIIYKKDVKFKMGNIDTGDTLYLRKQNMLLNINDIYGVVESINNTHIYVKRFDGKIQEFRVSGVFYDWFNNEPIEVEKKKVSKVNTDIDKATKIKRKS